MILFITNLCGVYRHHRSHAYRIKCIASSYAGNLSELIWLLPVIFSVACRRDLGIEHRHVAAKAYAVEWHAKVRLWRS